MDDVDAILALTNMEIFGHFDAGNRPFGLEPERVYHGLVLGLVVELSGKYMIASNRESGFGNTGLLLKESKC